MAYQSFRSPEIPVCPRGLVRTDQSFRNPETPVRPSVLIRTRELPES
jgi:hypothetical protein